MPQKRMECFRLLFDHLAWIEHQFLSGIRDSRKTGSLWGMMRGVGGVRKSIHQNWLAKGVDLELGLLCSFKGVQEEIPPEEASTVQIGVSGISTRTTHQSTIPSWSQTIWARWASTLFLCLPMDQNLLPCDFSLFPKLGGCRYGTVEEMKEAVTKVSDTLIQEDFHEAFENLLERYKQVHFSRRRLLRKGLEFHLCTLNKIAHTNNVCKLIVCAYYQD